MPHLSFGGLSEQWVLKECGHIHWNLLASSQGLTRPNFRDVHGRRLYAVFIEVRLVDGALTGAIEDAELTIRSELSRESVGRYLSRHVLSCNSQNICKITMRSAFVRRKNTGCNLSVERGFTIAEPGQSNASRRQVAPIDRQFPAQKRFAFTPCIYSDFNGADFLYFASYQSITDRAEACFFGPIIGTTRAREIHYYGNINPGDGIYIDLLTFKQVTDTLVYSATMCRQSDAVRIAAITVEKRILCYLMPSRLPVELDSTAEPKCSQDGKADSVLHGCGDAEAIAIGLA
ncbi:Pnap_2097 family protein [Mesorhizobium kowhaii]